MMLNRICIVLIQCYKMLISPLLGSQCRFSPTCSSYALQAFEKYVFFRALLMVFKRISKCHPLHPGGYDPV